MTNRDERIKSSTPAAQKELAKSGVLQIRIEPAILEQLYETANEKGVRYTAMCRDWLMERLTQEQNVLNGKYPMEESEPKYVAEFRERIEALENLNLNSKQQNTPSPSSRSTNKRPDKKN